MIHLVILAVDKKSACVKSASDICRYCGQHKNFTHMRLCHPELTEQMRDERDKEISGRQDRIEMRPKWHRYGRRI